MKTLRVAVIGCGLIGAKRARAVLRDPRSRLVRVADSDPGRAETLARECRTDWVRDWRKAAGGDVDAAVVSVPTHLLGEVSRGALAAGKHVLCEKPMGRDHAEALEMLRAAGKAGRRLKIGFNHRYHPALMEMRRVLRRGGLGRVLNARAVYGHGGRKGYESEWRTDPRKVGGGELTDQGVHVIDLLQWFFGPAEKAFAGLQTAFWDIRPLEDNGFAFLEFPGGIAAAFHTSWTQWKNAFSLEVFGTRGFAAARGLGGSYGPETLVLGRRTRPGAPPRVTEKRFMGEDRSWDLEWRDFSKAVRTGGKMLGEAGEGVEVMRTLAALYRSHRTGKLVLV